MHSWLTFMHCWLNQLSLSCYSWCILWFSLFMWILKCFTCQTVLLRMYQSTKWSFWLTTSVRMQLAVTSNLSRRIPMDCLVSREPTHLQLLSKTIQIYRVSPCNFTQVLFQPQLLYSVCIFVWTCFFFGLLVFDLYFWSIKLRNQSFRLISNFLLLLDSLVRYSSCGL